MSSANILRLLRDALALNNERLDLTSTQTLKVRPNVDDTGAVNIGDGTYDMDVKVFLGSASEYVLFDVGNSRLDVACGMQLTTPAVAAEHGAGAIGTEFAPRTRRWTENGVIITQIEIDLTGLDSSGVAADVIGLSTGGDAYIGRNVVATNGQIFRVEMSCIEVPLTGDADVLLVQGSESDEAFDDTVANTATLCDGTGDWALGETIVNEAPALTANYYYYLEQGSTDNNTYTAGQFLIRTYGHALMS
jgi:hypothetical protein